MDKPQRRAWRVTGIKRTRTHSIKLLADSAEEAIQIASNPPYKLKVSDYAGGFRDSRGVREADGRLQGQRVHWSRTFVRRPKPKKSQEVFLCPHCYELLRSPRSGVLPCAPCDKTWETGRREGP